MKAKDLNTVPDVKGAKRGQNSNDQVSASIKRENANEGTTKKVVYLRPKNEDKIDDFFKFYNQERKRQFDIETLFVSAHFKYQSEFGKDFVDDLLDDADNFTHHFTRDIVTKVEEGTDYTDISYAKGDVTICRYLIELDEPNLCSVFRHFMEYAKASGRPSVSAIIEREAKERELTRKEKSAEKKQAKENEKMGAKIQEMDIAKLMSLLTPEQLAAIAAAQAAK